MNICRSDNGVVNQSLIFISEDNLPPAIFLSFSSLLFFKDSNISSLPLSTRSCPSFLSLIAPSLLVNVRIHPPSSAQAFGNPTVRRDAGRSSR